MTSAATAPTARGWRARRAFAAHAKPISSVRLSRDGRLLASSCASASLAPGAAQVD